MLQKPGDNDGEANRKPALSFPRSPISPCITVTQMSNQASALNTEVPVSCFLSSPAPRLWLIVLPKRMISREHPFLEVMMQTWARGIKARAYHLYPFTREVSTLTASQLAYDLYHKKEFVFSRNCNKNGTTFSRAVESTDIFLQPNRNLLQVCRQRLNTEHALIHYYTLMRYSKEMARRQKILSFVSY